MSKLTKDERIYIYQKYNGHCAICGRSVKFKESTIDHIIPIAKGGTNYMDNLQLACDECNGVKSNLTTERLFEKIWELFMHNKKEIIKIQIHKALTKGEIAN